MRERGAEKQLPSAFDQSAVSILVRTEGQWLYPRDGEKQLGRFETISVTIDLPLPLQRLDGQGRHESARLA